jgi:hypothetical protein
MMGRIYAEAAGVVVWLRKSATDSQVSIPVIQGIVADLDRVGGVEDFLAKNSRLPFDDPDLYSQLDISPILNQEWDLLYKLFTRKWFQRVWVI